MLDAMSNTVQQEFYFCPNGGITKRVTRKGLSSKKKTQIRELHRLNKHWNVVVPFHMVLWLSTGSLAVVVDLLLVKVLCWVVAGLSLSTLSVLAHEATHNLFTHNPKIDRWIGFLCALPILFSPAGYRIIHPLHHKNARTSEDPDDVENISRRPRILAFLYVFVLIFGVYSYLIMVPLNAVRRADIRSRIVIILECAFMVTLVFLAWNLLGGDAMINGWLVPLLIAAQIGNIRGLAEHGLTSSGNEFTDTRTVKTHPVLSFLMCHINYHLEHHLYPGVPWYNLPNLHLIIADELREAGSSVYPSYGAFLMDVLQALKSGIVPGNRLIPLHVREEICL